MSAKNSTKSSVSLSPAHPPKLSRPTRIFSQILWIFLYALPAVLFFSYHPVISLGANASMNFELSLPLLWLVFFDFGAFILMLILGWKTRRLPGISDRRFFLLALLPLYLTISVFWSENPLRGLLTAGIIWLIFFAIFAMLYVLPLASPPRRLRTHVLLVFFISAALVCKFCYAQSVMDILGLSRNTTLLCPGCTYHSFGFPHPSGFAIEPQFMGNLLLAPTLTALYLVVFRSRTAYQNLTTEVDQLETTAESKILHNRLHLPRVNWSRWQVIGMSVLAGFFSMTLFFTFSRGAIYAYAIALLVLLVFALKLKTFRWSLITIPVISFLLSLGLQGTFAAVGPTAETFVSGVTKSIHQLSLGILDFRPQRTSSSDSNPPSDPSPDNSTSSEPVENHHNPVQNSNQNVDKPIDNSGKPEEKVPEIVENLATDVDKVVENHVDKSEQEAIKTTEDAIFEGYVPESTNIRLNLNQTAFDTWLSAPNHPESSLTIGLRCNCGSVCCAFGRLTPTSILFGVGLGGAGTAMHEAFPDEVASSKEIVQHEGFSLLLETGLAGITLVIFGLLVALFPNLFSRKFLDGKSAIIQSKPQSASPDSAKVPNTLLHHPALPLLVALIIAYLITLNFFSGLPNALHIYLMPPLLYLIFGSRYEPPLHETK